MKSRLNSGGRLISTYGIGSPISRPSNIANYNSAKVGSKLRKSDVSPDALHRRVAGALPALCRFDHRRCRCGFAIASAQANSPRSDQVSSVRLIRGPEPAAAMSRLRSVEVAKTGPHMTERMGPHLDNRGLQAYRNTMPRPVRRPLIHQSASRVRAPFWSPITVDGQGGLRVECHRG